MTSPRRAGGRLQVLAAASAVVFSIGAPSLAQQQAPPPPPSRITQAEAVVDALAAREFAKVSAQFDAKMKTALPDDALGSGWDDAIAKIGRFLRRAPARERQQGEHTVVQIVCDFERGQMDMGIVFDVSGQIAGMQMRPTAPAVEYAPPDYAPASAFSEREVTVGTGEWALPGTLTIPAGAGPFPAVVLVHGSGPNDRDESFGPNKTFKDLALGLGSSGVAVLRYDKRTFAHREKIAPLAQFTVKEETVDDALAAVRLLRADKSIDGTRIFVLGHSLGGMLAPRIAAADARLAGVIVMAGLVRPLEQTIVEQFQYLAEIDGTVSALEQKIIDDARRSMEQVGKLTPEDLKKDVRISGAPPSYWLDLRGFDPPAAAARLKHRILVIQGARDYQVTVTDFERWKTALAGKPNAQFRLYPTLNHLFLPGTGKSGPAEYSVPGHVPVEVINDIVQWIKG
jgi:hypothetical protein